MANAKRLGQFVQGDDRRISLPALQAAQVLLAKARLLGERLLRHPLALAYQENVAADKPAHVHRRRSAEQDAPVYQL